MDFWAKSYGYPKETLLITTKLLQQNDAGLGDGKKIG